MKFTVLLLFCLVMSINSLKYGKKHNNKLKESIIEKNLNDKFSTNHPNEIDNQEDTKLVLHNTNITRTNMSVMNVLKINVIMAIVFLLFPQKCM